MGISAFAENQPEKVAYVMAQGQRQVTYGELEAAANQGSQLFRDLGLKRGDHIAILLENHPLFFQIVCAAQRSGLYYTTISWRLQQEEVEYIVKDCDAKLFITSKSQLAVAEPLIGKLSDELSCYMLDGVAPGFESWDAQVRGAL